VVIQIFLCKAIRCALSIAASLNPDVSMRHGILLTIRLRRSYVCTLATRWRLRVGATIINVAAMNAIAATMVVQASQLGR
jgi:hypothetical protein